jgi:hypothetical protein
LNRAKIAAALQVRGQSGPNLHPVVLSIEAKLRRAGKGKRLIIANGANAEINQGLVELIKEAFAIRNQLLSGSDDSIEAMRARLEMKSSALPRWFERLSLSVGLAGQRALAASFSCTASNKSRARTGQNCAEGVFCNNGFIGRNRGHGYIFPKSSEAYHKLHSGALGACTRILIRLLWNAYCRDARVCFELPAPPILLADRCNAQLGGSGEI